MCCNSTKGGVDTIDRLVCCYSTKRMTRLWPMAIFYVMVDASALNALKVFLSLNQGAFGSRAAPTRSNLLIQLWKELAGYENQQPSNTFTCQLGDNKDMPSGPPQKKRCYVCPSKKDRKTKTLLYSATKTSVQNILLSFAVSREDCKPTYLCYIVMLST